MILNNDTISIQLRTPANAVLINLTLVEFLMAFVGVPMEVLPLLQDGWGPGKEVCIVTGTVVTTSGNIKYHNNRLSIRNCLNIHVSLYVHIYIYIHGFRLCLTIDSYWTLSMSNGSLRSYSWLGRKTFLVSIVCQVHNICLALLTNPGIASIVWVGSIRS